MKKCPCTACAGPMKIIKAPPNPNKKNLNNILSNLKKKRG